MFEVEWRGRRVALKASNGRYVCMKKNGQLAAVSDFVGEHSSPVPGPRASSPLSWSLLPAQAALAVVLLVGQDDRSGRQGEIRAPYLHCTFGEPGA